MGRLLLLPLVLSLAACSGPNESQIHADFRALHPGCNLLSSVPGEGDSDNVYMMLTYKCGVAPQAQSEVLYQRYKGQWVLNRKVSERGFGKSAGT